MLCTFFCHNEDTFFWLFSYVGHAVICWFPLFEVANSTCEAAVGNTSSALEQVLIDRGHYHMTDWRVATHSWLHTFLGWNGPYYLLALHMFFRFLKITGRPKLFSLFFFFFFKNQNQWFFHFFLISRDWNPGLLPVLGSS